MKKNILLAFSCLLLLVEISIAQYTVDWGKYLNDPVANADFNNDDESEQLAVDIKNASANEEYVYVIGRSNARNDHESSCTGSDVYYGAGDAFLAKYDRCGNLQWLRFMGTDKNALPASECGDFALCLALDHEANGKTVIYVAGYSYTNYDPFSCHSCSSCTKDNSAKAFSCSGDTCIFQKAKNSGVDCFIAKYDENGDLLRWTYFGGNGNVEYIFGIDVFDHHVFITGITNSDSSFIPPGTLTFDNTLSTGGYYEGDAFVARFDTLLCSLTFFSYLGGGGDERGRDIKAFASRSNPGRVCFYILGTTDGEMDNPLYHELNSFKGGSHDSFLTLWESDDAVGHFEPEWLQYVGGKGEDRGREMILSDSSNNAIITGYTTSKNFFTSTSWSYPTADFYDISFNGEKDAFIAKFDNTGNPLWGTYFGGSSEDFSRGLVRYSLGPAGNAINYVAVSGGTKSTDIPFQPLHPPFETALNGGMSTSMRDAFIAILTDPPSGGISQQLEFSSYFGGSQNELDDVFQHYGPDLALGGNQEIYMTFFSKSRDIRKYISSPNDHYNESAGKRNDGFLAKILNSNGSNQFNCREKEFEWGNPNSEKTADTSNEETVFSIFPNPASDFINIDIIGSGDLSWRLFNSFGQELMKGDDQSTDTTISIDISSLASGLYIFNLELNGVSHFRKLMLTR